MSHDISLVDLPDEQLAPFDKPEAADVCLIRLELERHRIRLNEASPIPPSVATKGQEI